MKKPHKRSKRHHLVPKFYLDRFAQGIKLRVVAREPPHRSYTASVCNTLVQKDFYSIETAEGWSSEAEDALAVVEADAARILRSFDEGRFPPSDKDRHSLSRYLSFQMLRTEEHRTALNQLEEHAAKMQFASLSDDDVRTRLIAAGEASTDADVAEAQLSLQALDKYRVVPHQNKSILLMFETVEQFIPHFEERGWWLVKFEQPALLSGDCPIYCDPGSNPRFPVAGVLSAESIVFPISSTRGLILGPKGENDQAAKMHPEAAIHLNYGIAHSCFRSIVHSPAHDPMQGIQLSPRGPMVRSGVGEGDRFKPGPFRPGPLRARIPTAQKL
jgi:hypothetical protein